MDLFYIVIGLYILSILCSEYINCVFLNHLEINVEIHKKSEEGAEEVYNVWRHEGFMLITHLAMYVLGILLPFVSTVGLYIYIRNTTEKDMYRFNHKLFQVI